MGVQVIVVPNIHTSRIIGAGAPEREAGMTEIKNGVDFLYICVPMLETEERKGMFHGAGGEGEEVLQDRKDSSLMEETAQNKVRVIFQHKCSYKYN
jgi:hypothetical protein